MFNQSSIEHALTILRTAKRIRCVCHRNPDGDAIGSIVGMTLLLEQQLPGVRVSLHCVDPAPPPFQFLAATARIEQEMQPMDGDVFIFLDSAEPKLTEYHQRLPQIFASGGDAPRLFPSICIDHHATNTAYASVNIVVSSASSTCEIIAQLAEHLGWRIDATCATALLTGIYTDTGGLLHSNTTPAVYRTVAALLRAGASQQTIVRNVFRTAKVSTLRLWGRVLEKISITEEGGAISALTEGDFRSTGAEYSELTGAIDYVNAIPGMRFSMVLAEKAGKVKGSLRTLRDDVDVSAMAAKFHGGGHKKAAGFALDGKLKPEVRWKVEK